jgi:tetratricopeptide (TPR) repeat protein
VISARRFLSERQDIEILGSATLATRWNDRPAVYLEKFSPSPAARQVSYDREARECEATDQWYAAVWYLDRLIGAEATGGETKEGADRLARRARAYGELGRWDRAAADAKKAMDLGTTEPKAPYWLAMARLQSGDREDYRRVCLETLEAADPAADADAANKAVWACVVVPDEKILENTDRLVAKAEQVVAEARTQEQDGSAEAPILHRALNTLGAVYYRAGKYDEAVGAFTESEREYENLRAAQQQGAGYGGSGKVWNWLFLAMVSRQLGKVDEGHSFLNKSVEALKQDSPQRLAEVTGVPSLSWDQRVTLDLLLQEATEVVGNET